GRGGVSTVLTTAVAPAAGAAAAFVAFLGASPGAGFGGTACSGAGSRDAQRHRRAHTAAARAHVTRLLDAGRSVLLQPYLDRVDEHGETALVFFDGGFSHATRKGPLLRTGEGPTDALFAAEDIRAREP